VQQQFSCSDTDMCIHKNKSSVDYELNLQKLKALHHSRCLFNLHPPVPDLLFWFNDQGLLLGEFICNGYHQGFDDMVHGGVISAIVDASMTQCLMGHGIVGYTADFSIKYRKPVMICRKATLETSVVAITRGLLYTMQCEIVQDRKLVVQATGRFFKVKQKEPGVLFWPWKGSGYKLMECKNHPGEKAVAICEKNRIGFCRECCACEPLEHCCDCLDPSVYCKFRTQCVIWELVRERRKAKST
jgi:hypothetical protein